MTLVVPKYRVLHDDTTSKHDVLALGLMQLVEPQVAVTWDLIPNGENIRRLEFDVGQRSVTARQVVLENVLLTSDTDVDLTAATKARVTSGHTLYHPATKQRFRLHDMTQSTGTATLYDVKQAPGGSRTEVAAGETLYILAQNEMYEEINAESRFEGTDKVTNYVQDITEVLRWSRADLRETRKWGVDQTMMLKERMKDIMKDLNNAILYNVPVAPTTSVPAMTAGLDYIIENAGNVVDAGQSGTADMADHRGVLKQLQKNGAGPSDGIFALMSIDVFHAYEDEGLATIDITGQPGAEFVIGNTMKGMMVSGIGFVPFFADPSINDDRVRYLAQNHLSKRWYQGENGPVETPHVEDEPSMSTSKTPVSTIQAKFGTDIRNASSVHYILDNTGLNG